MKKYIAYCEITTKDGCQFENDITIFASNQQTAERKAKKEITVNNYNNFGNSWESPAVNIEIKEIKVF